MKTTERTKLRREAHHAALAKLAGWTMQPQESLDLWRRLRRLERTLYAVCLDYTNGTNGVDSDKWEAAKEQGYAELARIFGGTIPAGVYINSDPRGHMLKLDSDQVKVPGGMECDWGNDGLLAAEIEEAA